MSYESAMKVPIVIPQWDQLPDLTFREKVAYLGHFFLSMPQSECPVAHTFGNKVYIREMRIPAGTIFLGRAHLKGHECSLIEGAAMWITPEGRREVHAPLTVHTTPGTHMVLYTLTDIVGQTVHPNPTEARDTDALENDIFEPFETLAQLGASLHLRLTA